MDKLSTKRCRGSRRIHSVGQENAVSARAGYGMTGIKNILAWIEPPRLTKPRSEASITRFSHATEICKCLRCDPIPEEPHMHDRRKTIRRQFTAIKILGDMLDACCIDDEIGLAENRDKGVSSPQPSLHVQIRMKL